MTENLWPRDFGELPEKTPVAILREQGHALGERTSNIVVGRVQTGSAGPGKFRHVLHLYCAPLGFSVELLYVDHEISLYPATISVIGSEATPIQAANAEEFSAHLKEIFSREKTKRTIASLLAQSKE